MKKLFLAGAVATAVAVSLLLAAIGGAANGNAAAAAVCPGSPLGSSHCHALVVTDAHGNPDATGSPTGLWPATIKSAPNSWA